MARFDDIKDKSLMSGRGEEILKRRSDRIKEKTGTVTKNLEQISTTMAEMDKVTSNLELDFEKKLERISALSGSLNELKRVQAQIKAQNTDSSFAKETKSALGAGAAQQDQARVRNSSQMYGPSLGLARKYQAHELEQTVQYSERKLRKQDDQVLKTASNIKAPGAEEQFKAQMESRDKTIRDIGRAKKAIEIQKQEGLDP